MMNTPLFKAAQRGDPEMVRLLLKYGARPNLLNALGESPFAPLPEGVDALAHVRSLVYLAVSFDELEAALAARGRGSALGTPPQLMRRQAQPPASRCPHRYP